MALGNAATERMFFRTEPDDRFWPKAEVLIVVKESGYWDRAENICSFRGSSGLTHSGRRTFGPVLPGRLSPWGGIASCGLSS